MNPSTKAPRWAALAALTIAITAQAASFDLNYTGSFNSSTTLGGVALGADTPFSITAAFDGDPSGDKEGGSGHGLFQVTTLSLTLIGHGTYTAIPDSNLNVVFISQGGSTYVGLV